jgi:tRNA threonylcarbamoyladenosine biosynthesis protein TsaE
MAGLGAALARACPLPLDEPLLLYLSGELGAGKTTLARGLLAAAGVAGPVRSPSYALIEVYRLARLTIVHADLYRLGGPEELDPLGLRELHAPGHLWIVEWPERAVGALPDCDLQLELSIEAAAHPVRLAGGGPRGAAWYAAALELVRVSH